MKILTCVASIGSLALLCACTTVREYPRCYLFRAPEAADVIRANLDVDRLLRDALHQQDIAIGKDVVTVNAASSTHRKLAEAWPMTGCVNLRRAAPEVAEINDKWVVARCGEYLDAILRNQATSQVQAPTAIAQRFSEFTCH